MFNFILSFISRLGGFKAVGSVLACLLPLVLLQCSRSSLEDLREKHSALEAGYAALRDNLARCREAASLHDLVLMERERETVEITNKYNRLREDFLRGLLSVENNDESAKTSMEAPLEACGEGLAEAAESFKDWCAQPLPSAVRELFADPANSAGTPLPAASGHAPHEESPAGNPRL